jgi:hypothetical protein
MITICFLYHNYPHIIIHNVTLCILFETLIELLQYLNFINGTFDIYDIFFEFISNLLAIAIWIYNKSKPKEDTTI